MPRPAQFSSRAILDAATDLAADVGPAEVSVADLSAELGAPTGSIYYRFKSRDDLLASVWLDAVETFQSALSRASREGGHGRDAGALARFVVEWCRVHLIPAKILTLYRREEWLGDRVSEDVRARAKRVNRPMKKFLTEIASANFGQTSPHAIQATQLAIAVVPAAMVTESLRTHGEIPSWLAGAAEASARATIEEAKRCNP